MDTFQTGVIYCTKLSILHITYAHNTTADGLSSVFLSVDPVSFRRSYNCISVR